MSWSSRRWKTKTPSERIRAPTREVRLSGRPARMIARCHRAPPEEDDRRRDGHDDEGVVRDRGVHGSALR